MSLSDIFTPALLLDREILARNAARMTSRAAELGLALRPHLKTAKCREVAALATAGHDGGLTVSTLAEAEYFAGGGYRDLFYAVPLTPNKLARASILWRQGVRLIIAVDSLALARLLGDAAQGGLERGAVRLEIDCGEHRGGFAPADPDLVESARLLAAAGFTLEGVFTHAGHAYRERSPQAIAAVARDEWAAAATAATVLRRAGFPCPSVSIGSTPTACHADPNPGATELRCGVYLFGDLFQAGIGSHACHDIALSVLATVLSHRPGENCLVIDAGSLALSKDRSTAALPAELDAGFGLLADADGRLFAPRLRVEQVYQEHGMVRSESPIPFDRLAIGTQVRVFPNHACLTAAAFDHYHVIAEGKPVARWSRCNGW